MNRRTGWTRGFMVLALAAPFGSFSQTNAPVPAEAQLITPYRVEIVASRLQAPWSVVLTPDGRVFFSERPGWVRVIDGGRVLERPALLLKDVAPSVKMGLLGLAVDPAFSRNHFIYAAYNYELEKERYRMRVVRFVERDNQLLEPHTLIGDIPAYRNHTGGQLRFGPDGCLYITTGDANNPSLAQRLDSLAGKILRLNPDGSVPAENPFVGLTNAFGAIWSYGHRNPQGLDFQPDTGVLFATEHGPDHGDEMNLVVRGGNYGWPIIHHRQSREGMRSPLMEFTPAVAPAGAVFYRGKAFPELTGKLLVGCLRGESILQIGFLGTNAVSCGRLLHFKYGRIRAVSEGPDGSIYFTTSQFDPPEGTPRHDYDLILRLVPKTFPTTGAALAAEWTGPHSESPVSITGTTSVAQIIQVYCASCHGSGLRGGLQGGVFSSNESVKDGESIRRVISRGLPEKGMPSFGGSLKPEQIAAMAEFILKNAE